MRHFLMYEMRGGSKKKVHFKSTNGWAKYYLNYSIKISLPNVVLCTSIEYSLKKLLFISILICSIIGLGYQLYNLAKASILNEVLTEIKLNEARVIYPDILICSYSPVLVFKYNKAQKYTNESLWNSLSRIWKLVERNSSKALKNSKLNFFYSILVNSMMADRSKYILPQNISSISSENREMVFDCKFQGKICKSEEILFSNFHNIPTGTCSRAHLVNPRNELLKEGRTERLQLQLVKETSYIYDLRVGHVKDLYNLMNDIISDGFYIYTAEPQTYPNLNYFFPLSFKSKLTLGIQMSTNVVKNTKCIEDNKLRFLSVRGIANKQQTFQYSELLCRKLFLQRTLMERCGCLSYEYPISVDIQPVDGNPRFCIWIPKTMIKEYQTLMVTQPDMDIFHVNMLLRKYGLKERWECYDKFIIDSEDIFNRIDIKDCPVCCTSYVYQYRTSYSKWPRHTVALEKYLPGRLRNHAEKIVGTKLSKQYMNYTVNESISLERLLYSIAELEVFIEINRGDSFTQIDEWSSVMILSNIGSITGLWVGGSIISLIELMELFVLFFIQKYYGNNN